MDVQQDLAVDRAEAESQSETAPKHASRSIGRKTHTEQAASAARDRDADADTSGNRHAVDDSGVSENAAAAVAAASSSSGQPLPAAIQRKFEGSLGADLSQVRVHSGSASAAAAESLSARAYTIGNDIHFNQGQYDPSSPTGEQLLAHEVAHTVQQAGVARRVQLKLEVSAPGDAHEAEADRAAEAMIAGKSAAVSPASGTARQLIQRDDKDKSKGKGEEKTGGGEEDSQKWQELHNRCSEANTYLGAAYAGGEVFIRNCTQNYKQGYDDHKAAIDRQKAADQLAEQLILGVIFAAAGGAAGGAVGVVAGNLLKNIAISATSKGAITDAAKDLAKYIARLPPTLLGSKGGGKSVDANVSDTPMAPGQPTGASGQGAGAPAAMDPFTWHNGAMMVLAKERQAAYDALLQMQQAAGEGVKKKEPYSVSFDPLVVVKQSCKIAGHALNELATLQVPTALQYERAFWEEWLKQYAYKIRTVYSHVAIFKSVEGNVGKELKAEIDRVAGKFGETGDQWIERYGGKAAKEKEAADWNRKINHY